MEDGSGWEGETGASMLRIFRSRLLGLGSLGAERSARIESMLNSERSVGVEENLKFRACSKSSSFTPEVGLTLCFDIRKSRGLAGEKLVRLKSVYLCDLAEGINILAGG